MQKDLTSGSVFKNTLSFSLPFMVSYFLQTLYGMADLFIIGKFGNAPAITAVSIGSQVMHMATVIIVGLAMGTTVGIGHAVGKKDNKSAADCTGNTITVFVIFSFVLTLTLTLLVNIIVSAMSTPEEAVADTISYLRICFLGIPFITAYNVISSIFRGYGDSKSPMLLVAFSCALNIALDWIFIGTLNMGPSGAALATVLAQAVSVAISPVFFIKLKAQIKLSRKSLIIDRNTTGQILKTGVPIALQDGLVQIAFMVITVIANKRGLTDAAAVGIVEKIICFLFLVPSSMLSAVSALGAQNIGAGKPERAVLTLRYAVFTAAGFGIAAAVLIQFTANGVIGLFTDDAAVISAGAKYIRGYIFDCIFAGVHFCFSGYFCACGKSFISFIHNIASIVAVRIPGAYFTSKAFPSTLLPMGIATAAGSLFSAAICVFAFIMMRRKPKESKLPEYQK